MTGDPTPDLDARLNRSEHVIGLARDADEALRAICHTAIGSGRTMAYPSNIATVVGVLGGAAAKAQQIVTHCRGELGALARTGHVYSDRSPTDALVAEVAVNEAEHELAGAAAALGEAMLRLGEAHNALSRLGVRDAMYGG